MLPLNIRLVGHETVVYAAFGDGREVVVTQLLLVAL